MDTRLDQLMHRRAGGPELAELETVGSRLVVVADLLVAASTEVEDITREQVKADADVEQVRQRAERDQRRLDAGQVSSPKELESLQHEIASLARRQGELEDIELEIMERLESAQRHATELLAERDRLTATQGELIERRDAAFAEIDAEVGTTRVLRDVLSSQIDASLVELYEKIRAGSGGVGAAALRHRQCEGCRLELNSVDLGRFRAAEPDEVLRCEECRRILVRTDESGL